MRLRRNAALGVACVLVAITAVDGAVLWRARPALLAGLPGDRYVVNMASIGEVDYVAMPSLRGRHSVRLTGVSCPEARLLRCSGAVFEPGAELVQIAVEDDADLRRRHLPLPRPLPLYFSGQDDPKHQMVVVLTSLQPGYVELRSLTLTYIDGGRRRTLHLPCKYDVRIAG